MVTAAGAGVPSVKHEFFGGQTRFARRVVQKRGAGHDLVPRCRRLHVHLDDARIRRHLEVADARITRRLVALDEDRLVERIRRRFHRGDQFQVVIELTHRRHEDIQHAIARLCAHRRARQSGGGFFAARRRIQNQRRARHITLPDLPADFGMRQQCGKRTRRIRRMNEGIIAGGRPSLRIERQSIADR